MRRATRSLIAGVLVIVAALGFVIYQGLANNLEYYITPTELMAKTNIAGQSFRVGGQVKSGSVRWNVRTATLTFVLKDPKTAVAVVSHGEPPQLFKPGAGVVVEGTYRAGQFLATQLMMHHDSTYVAPRAGATPNPDSFEGK
jgi:cytochrome c-type biogenesis protein CcmE